MSEKMLVDKHVHDQSLECLRLLFKQFEISIERLSAIEKEMPTTTASIAVKSVRCELEGINQRIYENINNVFTHCIHAPKAEETK